jgi:arylsulfatase A-like enzyme
MPRLARETDNWDSGTAIAQSAATYGSFASILASKYHPQAYDGEGGFSKNVEPLPEILSKQGYQTGGFVASNPYVGRWDAFFDKFWNDGLSPGKKFNQSDDIKSKLTRLINIVRFKDRVTASEIGDRAANWISGIGSPSFLWVHLMDTHEPYLPGLSRALSVGPVSSYNSLKKFHSDRGNLTDKEESSIRKLYYASVEYLNSQIDTVCEAVPNDSIVVITGDHGEEFDHGQIGHARLYDEVVATPFFANWDYDTGEYVRHIDIAPTVTSAASGSPTWEGVEGGVQSNQAFLINQVPSEDIVYIGIRTNEHKYIETYKIPDWNKTRTELYHLGSDPDEMIDLSEDKTAVVEQLSVLINEFLDQDDVDKEMLDKRVIGFSESGSVQERLQDLGYV